MTPRVSLLVSHYDRQALLREALASAAAQTFRDFEIVVVSDAGPDASALVAEFAAGPGRGLDVRYVARARNGGIAAARNTGVAAARGALLLHLDDDDLLRPDALEGLVAALDAEPAAGLAYGDADVWRMEPAVAGGAEGARGAGGTDGAGGAWRVAERRRLAVPFSLEDLQRDDFIVPGGMLYRRGLYDAAGPFDPTIFVSDDWDWLLRAVRVAPFVRCPRVVVTVRIWSDGSNLSSPGSFVARERLAALAELERRHGTPPLEPKTFWEVAGTYEARSREAASGA